MKDGIQRQVLQAGLLPTAIVTLVVAAWLIGLRIGDLHVQQKELGHALVSQLAPAAEYGLFSGNAEVLQRLAEAALLEADVRAVRISAHDGALLASAVDADAGAGGASAPSAWLAGLIVDAADTIVFRQSVLQPVTDLGEFDLPLPHDAGPVTLGVVEVEMASLPGLARQIDVAFTGLLILLGAMLASLALARRLGSRIAAPIERLATAMQDLREGKRGVRVPETSTNELGALESGLNRMADEIARTQVTLEERIAQATHELQQMVEALEINNVELDLARKRALEASVLKTEFLAAMSHDIRTPMTAIIGYTRMLAGTPLDAEQHEQVTTIQHSADALLHLINDILDLSRIEAGKLSLAAEPFDIRACLDEVVRLLAPLAGAKGLVLRHRVHPEVPAWVEGDRIRLQQVMTNLIDNAIKYTEHGGVEVEVRRHPGADYAGTTLALVVEDTGVGIPAEVQGRLFRAFARAEHGLERHSGSGLGLAICNRLIEAMNGEIELHSEPGVGSRVTATFEVGTVADAPAAARPLDGNHDGARTLAGLRVLVVDDHPVNRVLLARQLRALGAETVECDGGAQAMESCDGDTDIVLLDLQMPGMDGAALADLLRRRPQPPLLVAVTANAFAPHDPGLHMSGIAGLFVKPVDEWRLAAGLARMFAELRAARGTVARLDPDIRAMLAEDLPGLVASLRNAARGRDATALRGALHDLAGIAGSCRLDTLREPIALARAALEADSSAIPQDELDAVSSGLVLIENEVCDRWTDATG